MATWSRHAGDKYDNKKFTFSLDHFIYFKNKKLVNYINYVRIYIIQKVFEQKCRRQAYEIIKNGSVFCGH